MTIQYELDFTTDYLVDLLFDLQYMAHIYSTKSHLERTANEPAYNELRMQVRDLLSYAYISDIIDYEYSSYFHNSILASIELYWGA